MDFHWLREELAGLGLRCEVEDLQRAEAAARPGISAELQRLKSTESRDAFIFYMRAMLEKLPAATVGADHKLDGLIREIVPLLQAPGQNQRLWSGVLPGVSEALEILKEKALQLAVVSNSDGTVEEILQEQGLRHYFDVVVDSHLVGFEKPDPRLFYHAIALSRAAPEQTLHIGDMYDADVLGARSVGLHAILLDPYDDWCSVDCRRFPDLLSVASEIRRHLP